MSPLARMSNPQVPATSLMEDHVFLTGRPPMEEFLSLVLGQGQAVGANAAGEVANEWRTANDHIRELEARESGLADNAFIEPLLAPLEPLAQQLLADPIFQRAFALLPTKLGMVELDRLIVFQKDINLEAVRRVQSTLPSKLTEEDVFRLCLPVDHPHPQTRGMRIAQNAFAFVSPSADFRSLDVNLFEGNPIPIASYSGPVSHLLAFAVGHGANMLQAVHAEGRLVLGNGSHRAYALREIGIQKVPCVIQEVTRREELPVTGLPIAANPDTFLKSPRPPLLKDYFDVKLRKVVRLPKKSRQVRITFQIETTDIPTQ
jgi:hypothetical protein